MVIKTLVLVDSNDLDYKTLFETNISELERDEDINSANINSAIAYINNQSKDSNRCKELFDEKTVLRISNLLKHNSLDSQTKIYCCEIINNCL